MRHSSMRLVPESAMRRTRLSWARNVTAVTNRPWAASGEPRGRLFYPKGPQKPTLTILVFRCLGMR